MVAITEYFTNGSTILAEKLTNTADETVNDIPWYIYDSDGELLGFTYNGTPYYYVKNVQGDVYRIVDSNGQVVASYTYDAWGKFRKDASNGWGFCDLYHKDTGEVWKLKKHSNSKSCQTPNALNQLQGYVDGRLKHNLNLELRIADTTKISANSFSFERGNYVYSVHYWSENNGILRYSYDREKLTPK